MQPKHYAVFTLVIIIKIWEFYFSCNLIIIDTVDINVATKLKFLNIHIQYYEETLPQNKGNKNWTSFLFSI